MLQQILLAILFLIGPGSALGFLPPCFGNLKTELCKLQILKPFNPPFSSRVADCSSYQRVVVTPSPQTLFTTVATETITVTVTSGSELNRRAELAARQTTSTPTSVPTYLGGPCTEPGIYGSACACLGIRRTTSTAPTPTVTSSVTTTTTTTTTVPPTPTCTGATCDSYTIVNCGLGPFGICACGTDAGGNSFCFSDQPCGSSCTSNTDCDQGYRCLVDSCCSGPVCIPEVPTDQCINPAVAQIQSLSGGGFNSTVCSSLSCPAEALRKRAVYE